MQGVFSLWENGLKDSLPREFIAKGVVVALRLEHPFCDTFFDICRLDPNNIRQQHGSMREPITAAASNTARAEEESRAARASTASRTVSGILLSTARASVTKNGLPFVRR